MFELSDNQKNVLSTDGHLLVTGGPGSGKTTVSILKAALLAQKMSISGQEVLFLSFARATVSRVWEALEENSSVSIEVKKRIVVDTYHSFFWNIIKTHGYLLGLPRSLTILTPSAEAIALSSIRNTYPAAKDLDEDMKRQKNQDEDAERNRLAMEEGRVCFDLFSSYVASILHSSKKVRQLISTAFPYVILDEFQDTSSEQWDVVRAMGINSTLIALADPEQRIFDFIGADPERLDHFKQTFIPAEYDLSNANHRSAGTDISKFGNDILTGNIDNQYSGIYRKNFESYSPPQAYTALKGQVLSARTRLINSGKDDWSLAILVPTKKMMRSVSDSLREAHGSMPAVNHQASIDMHGAILSGEIIAFLLQPKIESDEYSFIHLLLGFFQGKGGETPSKSDINTAQSIEKAYSKVLDCRARDKSIPANSIMNSILNTYEIIKNITLTGNVSEDWLCVRNLLENEGCIRMKQIAAEAKNLRLLNRGTQLREALSQNWRDHGVYHNALDIIQQAFIKEHFATSVKPETGVVVMNMHKAKGKQFDEVIIFEGWPNRVRGKIVGNPDRIVRGNSKNQDLSHYRQNFRVSVTRAKTRTTIMTPKTDPCVLLT